MKFTQEQLDKYNAIREDSLVFKCSDGLCLVKNSDEAVEKFNELVSIDLDLLEYNKISYAYLLNDQAKVIDVIKIVLLEEYFVVLHSDNDVVRAWLKDNLEEFLAEENNLYSELLGVEGPYAWRLLKEVFGYEITGLQYLRVISLDLEEHSFTVLRESISGEYGYKILMSKDAYGVLAQKLEESEELKIKSIENLDKTLQNILGAEVRIPLMDSFFKENSCPVENETRWLIDFNKESFNGKAKLEAKIDDFEYRLVPFVFQDDLKDLTMETDSFPVQYSNENIGFVSAVYYSPKLSKQFGYAYIKKEYAYTNVDAFEVEVNSMAHKITTENSPLLITESSNVTVS